MPQHKRELLFELAFGLCQKRPFSSTIISNSDNSLNNIVSGKSKSDGAEVSFTSISKLGTKVYVNPVESRELIRKDNNGKVGVYCWFNNVNGKFYVGSGDPLYMRLSDYYQD